MCLEWIPCSSSDCLCPNHIAPYIVTCDPDAFAFELDATFPHLASTNSVPVPNEESEILSRILPLQTSLAQLENTARKLAAIREALDAQLQSIDDNRQTLQSAINAAKRFLSPARRLPPEIWQRVFLQTVDFPVPHAIDRQRLGDTWWNIEDYENPLWTMELVCRDWRQIILSNPRLWSFININIRQDLSLSQPRNLSRMSLHVERAALCPLSVCFFVPSDDDEDELSDELLMFLFSFVRRIETLCLLLPLDTVTSMEVLQTHLVSLSTLYIVNTPYSEWDEEHDGLDDITAHIVFAKCTSLREVTLVDVSTATYQLPLPWNQVVSYSCLPSTFGTPRDYIPGPYPKDVRRALKEAEKLEVCNIKLHYQSETFDNLAITCNLLTDLTITCTKYISDNLVIREFFEGLTLPALRALAIRRDILIQERTIQDSRNFLTVVEAIQRSHCPLERFEFGDGDITSVDLMRFIHTTTDLEELHLRMVGDVQSPAFNSDIAVALSEATLLPRLRVLEISGGIDVGVGEIIDMVDSRVGSTPLTNLDLGWVLTSSEDAVRDATQKATFEGIIDGILSRLEEHHQTDLVYTAMLHIM